VIHRQSGALCRGIRLGTGLTSSWISGHLRSCRHSSVRRATCLDPEHGGAIGGFRYFSMAEMIPERKLGLRYVEPPRGTGHRRALVAAAFPKDPRERLSQMTLWTKRVLVSARRPYEAAGFRIVGRRNIGVWSRTSGADVVLELWLGNRLSGCDGGGAMSAGNASTWWMQQSSFGGPRNSTEDQQVKVSFSSKKTGCDYV